MWPHSPAYQPREDPRSAVKSVAAAPATRPSGLATGAAKAALALLLLLAPAWAQTAPYPNRWVWVVRSLDKDSDVEDIRQIAKTAAAHGLTGIVLNAGLDLISLHPDAEDRLRKVKTIAARAGIEIIPALFSIGWGSAVVHDRNLAEGWPVVDQVFVAGGGQARLAPEPVQLVNGGFEENTGNTFKGWFSDAPGQASFADTGVFGDGRTSLRFDVAKSPNSLARIIQQIAVKPHRAYRVTWKQKTEGLQSPGAFYMQVLAGPDSRALGPVNLRTPETAGWHTKTWGFNSQGFDKVGLYLGTWGAVRGRFWLDSVKVEEVGPLNVLRRPGTPVTVRSETGGVVYQEGKDYEPVSDGPLFTLEYEHDPPPIQLTRRTRIRQGERLLVSYYQGMQVENGQISVCMSEPKLYEIFAEQARIVEKALRPTKYFLSVDEVRVAASCLACKRRGIGAAQILGETIAKLEAIVRRVNPRAEIYVWSDMLDPNHNARPNFYLVDGDLTGSWKYVPQDLGIVNWNFDRRAASLAHFAGLGFRQIAATYYDAGDLAGTQEWLKSLAALPAPAGVMYATFENKYALLPSWGDLVRQPPPRR